ncbi:exodeoxyribonuclease V subunit alpha [Amphibiibacter pelophylacis]|uniref:Exodeoxyribonuclease V subunit alpha n=1 Tax=Amphibiibacter pelophylacis TaxID=1799477 RepID=A0ACC6P068_9BURK
MSDNDFPPASAPLPADGAALIAALDAAARAGVLGTSAGSGDLPVALARMLFEQAPDAPPLLLLAAALAAHQVSHGHVALDLAAVLAHPRATLALRRPQRADAPPTMLAAVPDPADWLQGLTLPAWLTALQHPLLVAAGEGGASLEGTTPLVLSQAGGRPRLYLRRYWQHEQGVRAALAARLRPQPSPQPLPQPDAVQRQRQVLNALFPPDPAAPPGPDWQKLACALATLRAFAVITGGPGTGKTTTVVRLLALLQSLALGADGQGRPLRIRLAAPTGKAAARLNASITAAVYDLARLDIPHAQAVREQVPVQVSTLHRLLGRQPNRRRFRHHAGAPLPLDVLVVDEASMVDLDLMAALVDALPAHARLILLGDSDQLASVDAGAVLGELCERAADGHYWPATRKALAALCGDTLPDDCIDPDGQELDQAVIMLRHSRRFVADSGIGQLARAVNRSDGAELSALRRRAQAGELPDLAFVASTDWAALVLEGRVSASVASVAESSQSSGPVGYANYLRLMHQGQPGPGASRADLDAWAARVLAAHSQFQLLCALRDGPWGVSGLNQRVAQLLGQQGLIDPATPWYAGRPVLVTANDAALGLVNGDVGLTLRCPAQALDPALPPGQMVLRVAFPAASSGDGAAVRWMLPARLPQAESVYALTVHKSQGSEFTHTALVLPPAMNPVMTRELLYTGITRARRWLSVLDTAPAGLDILAQASRLRVQRAGGLLAVRLGE